MPLTFPYSLMFEEVSRNWRNVRYKVSPNNTIIKNDLMIITTKFTIVYIWLNLEQIWALWNRQRRDWSLWHTLTDVTLPRTLSRSGSLALLVGVGVGTKMDRRGWRRWKWSQSSFFHQFFLLQCPLPDFLPIPLMVTRIANQHTKKKINDVLLLQDQWILRFWFRGSADGLTKKKAFTEYFQELVNPKGLPKSITQSQLVYQRA